MNYLRKLTKKWLTILLLIVPIGLLYSDDSETSTTPHHEPEIILLDDCLLIANEEIATLTVEAKEALRLAVTEAVATEQRHFLPIVAGLETEVEGWKTEAGRQSFWDEYGLAMIGGGFVIGGITALVLATVIPK